VLLLYQALADEKARNAATSEILQAINGSPGDLQPVFDLIARKAAEICSAGFCNLLRYDGTRLHFCANFGFPPALLAEFVQQYPMRPAEGSVSAAAVETGEVAHLDDAQTADYFNAAMARAVGWRRMLGVPIHCGPALWGVIVLAWSDTAPPPPAHIDMIRSFADLAGIAINNAELFNEERARTAEVTEALEYQTATSEVLGVISRSPNELQPVLEAILDVAVRLCKPHNAYISLLDASDGYYHIRSFRSDDDQFAKFMTSPIQPTQGGSTGRAALLGQGNRVWPKFALTG
jgi:GAF domain-containing protein